jgi:branched-chain amino acid transport system permease protein
MAAPRTTAETTDTNRPSGVRGPTAVVQLGRLSLSRAVLLLLVLAALAVLAALPWLLTGFWTRVLTTVFMFGALAQSLNLIAGFVGRADFGNIVYFGLGAYTTGFLFLAGVPFPLGIAGGALLAGLIATLIGLPILRLKGHYFAIATIGIMEGTRQIVNNAAFLGGGGGMVLPVLGLDPRTFNTIVYFAMLGLMLGYTGIVYRIARGSLGYELRAIKADEQAASVMGINTTRAKTSAWAMSAGGSAIVGGVYAMWVGFISPQGVFSIVTGTEYFIMMLVGGAGTVLGPIVGAVIIELLTVTVWANFVHGHLAILGLAIVLVVVFLPNGIVPTVRRRILGR